MMIDWVGRFGTVKIQKSVSNNSYLTHTWQNEGSDTDWLADCAGAGAVDAVNCGHPGAGFGAAAKRPFKRWNTCDYYWQRFCRRKHPMQIRSSTDCLCGCHLVDEGQIRRCESVSVFTRLTEQFCYDLCVPD